VKLSLVRLDCQSNRAMQGSPCKFRLSFCGSSEKSPLAIALMAGAYAGLAGGISAGCCSWLWWKGQSHPARCDRPGALPGRKIDRGEPPHPRGILSGAALFIDATFLASYFETAREWALSLAPELAYFFGLVVQMYRRQQQVSSGQEPPLPLAFATHGRCVRDGFDDPDKLALRQVLGALYPRVAVHNRYSEIEGVIRRGGTYETMDDAARRVRRALREERRRS
jgi:hypothetical protein